MRCRTEGELAKALTDLQNQYPHITMGAKLLSRFDITPYDIGIDLGSYPKWGQDKVLISLEGTDAVEVERVATEVKEAVGGYELHPH
jgi:hypothetical protein